MTDITDAHEVVELKPCPFCGGPAKVIETMGERIYGTKEPPFYGPMKKRVVCGSLYQRPTRPCPERETFETEAEAIAAWNTRTPDASQAELVSALEEIAGGLPRERAPHRWSKAREIALTALAKIGGAS